MLGLCSLAWEDLNIFPLPPAILNLENGASWGQGEGTGQDAGSLHLSPSGKFTSAPQNTTTQEEQCPQRAV